MASADLIAEQYTEFISVVDSLLATRLFTTLARPTESPHILTWLQNVVCDEGNRNAFDRSIIHPRPEDCAYNFPRNYAFPARRTQWETYRSYLIARKHELRHLLLDIARGIKAIAPGDSSHIFTQPLRDQLRVLEQLVEAYWRNICYNRRIHFAHHAERVQFEAESPLVGGAAMLEYRIRHSPVQSVAVQWSRLQFEQRQRWRSTVGDVLLSFATPLIVVLVNVTTLFSGEAQRVVNILILACIAALLLYQSWSSSVKTVESNERLANIILDDFRRLQCRLVQVYIKAALSIKRQQVLYEEQLQQPVDNTSPHEGNHLLSDKQV